MSSFVIPEITQSPYATIPPAAARSTQSRLGGNFLCAPGPRREPPHGKKPRPGGGAEATPPRGVRRDCVRAGFGVRLGGSRLAGDRDRIGPEGVARGDGPRGAPPASPAGARPA